MVYFYIHPVENIFIPWIFNFLLVKCLLTRTLHHFISPHVTFLKNIIIPLLNYFKYNYSTFLFLLFYYYLFQDDQDPVDNFEKPLNDNTTSEEFKDQGFGHASENKNAEVEQQA